MAFGADFYRKISNKLESWVLEQSEFILQMATLLVAYLVFLMLRRFKVEGQLIDLLDGMDRVAIAIVFARFLYGNIRRAFATKENE